MAALAQHSPDLTRAARASQASWRSPPMGARLPESIRSDAGVGMCAAALGGADALLLRAPMALMAQRMAQRWHSP